MSNEVETVRSSVVQLRIGSRTYNMVENRNCGVCMHPGRFSIEAKIMLNYGWSAVSRYVSDLNKAKVDGTQEDWYAISPAQVKAHYEKGHCPDSNVSRALVEERAKKRGIDLEEATDQFVDHVIVQHAVLARGYERLMEGKIEPDVKDMLAASKLIGDAETGDADNGTIEQWQEFMGIYFSAVQTVVSRDQWEEIVREIQKHPVFSAMNAAGTNDSIIEAEVIND